MRQQLKAYSAKRPYVLLLVILLIGLLVRVYLLPTAGFALDLVQHYDWALCANEYGLFGVYRCPVQVTHPPLSPTMLGAGIGLLRLFGGDISYFEANPAVVAMLKLPNVLFETALIGLFFRIAYEKAGVWWAGGVTAALYWNPGWLVVTAWWGQNDATYSFFMLLTAYLLTKRHPRWMWAAYALGWLAKFQSIMFFPVLLVFSLRRFGWRASLEGLLLYAAILGIGVLPFVLGSGRAGLTPYVGTVNLFPYITNGAYNLWYWVSGSSQMVLLDSLQLLDGISYQQAGLVLFALGTAILCLRAWLLRDRDDEYLVLAAANFSFFMLPTQIQVRYLYPGLMFLVLAMIRNWKLVAIYAGLTITFTYNVFDIVWLGVGLLYYPYRLMFWQEVHNALAVSLMYLVFMALFLAPLLTKRK